MVSVIFIDSIHIAKYISRKLMLMTLGAMVLYYYFIKNRKNKENIKVN